MHAKIAVLVFLGVDLPLVITNPLPQGLWGVNICPETKYKDESHESAEGPPVIGSKTCTGNDDCELSDGSSYTVGVTVEAGIEAGLDFKKIVDGASLSASVSYTEEKTETLGVTVTCPHGPWKCSLIIYPGMIRIKGTVTSTPVERDGACDDTKSEPYSVLVPRTGPDKTSSSRIEICVCTNFQHWADKGAPKIKCPENCA